MFIDKPDVQGLAFSGYARWPHSVFRILRIRDAAAAKAWLAGALETLTFGSFDRKQTAEAPCRRNLAFTAEGLCRLGLPEQALLAFEAPFREGMTNGGWKVTNGEQGLPEQLQCDVAIVGSGAGAGITAEQLDCFVPHQANNRITDAMASTLRLPDTVKIARDIIDAGNTSAASVPMALDRMIAEGDAKSGDLALLIAFGAGLAYAAQVVTVP